MRFVVCCQYRLTDFSVDGFVYPLGSSASTLFNSLLVVEQRASTIVLSQSNQSPYLVFGRQCLNLRRHPAFARLDLLHLLSLRKRHFCITSLATFSCHIVPFPCSTRCQSNNNTMTMESSALFSTTMAISAYQHTALIYEYVSRRGQMLSASPSPAQSSVKRILQCVSSIKLAPPPSLAILVTPVFTAGCKVLGAGQYV
jgi:hypothetical protein